MSALRVLDLFSGIGGFSLGLERAGMRTVAFCECDPYCQAVLRKHWPAVPVFGDVRELTAEALADANVTERKTCDSVSRRNGESAPRRSGTSHGGIDVVCGGFPCQDISFAGKGAGLDGIRSGLWSEFARIIGEVRPRFVIVENVAALLGRGFGRVLGDLAALGFDAEWHCIPACAVGAPHRRDRVWIVANANDRWELQSERCEPEERRRIGNGSKAVADADDPRLERWLGRELQECADERIVGQGSSQWDEQRWFAESGMGRVSNGISNRVERLRALGNAIVPQIATILGKAIIKAEQERWQAFIREPA